MTDKQIRSAIAEEQDRDRRAMLVLAQYTNRLALENDANVAAIQKQCKHRKKTNHPQAARVPFVTCDVCGQRIT